MDLIQIVFIGILLWSAVEKFNLLDEKITLEKAKQICTNISFYDFEKYTKEWYINNNINLHYVEMSRTLRTMFEYLRCFSSDIIC